MSSHISPSDIRLTKHNQRLTSFFQKHPISSIQSSPSKLKHQPEYTNAVSTLAKFSHLRNSQSSRISPSDL